MFLILVVLSLLVGTFSVSAADDLTGYKYEHQMRELIDLGIMAGYPDGTYKPERTVTRAEFAKLWSLPSSFKANKKCLRCKQQRLGN